MQCPDCKADFPKSDGPAHRYLGASPACWAAYSEVLAKEYSEPAWFANHRFTVDAYALQHPGQDSPQSRQSVNLHFLALTLMFKYMSSPTETLNAMKQLSARSKSHPEIFDWLTPPRNLGLVTVKDIMPISDLEQHLQAVKNWAETVWKAWGEHHDYVDALISRYKLVTK